MSFASRNNQDVHLLDLMAEEGIDTTHLSPVGVRPPLDDYLTELWQRRHFIWVDSRKRVASKYSNSKLGKAWFLLQPLLDAVFYWLIFGMVLGVSRGIDNFVAYIIIGILLFRATQRTLSAGVTSINGAHAMIRAFSFPRASIPLSLTLRNAVESWPMVAVVLVLIMLIPPHEYPSATWLLLPVFWVLQMLMNLGIALWTSRLGHMLPDAQYIMSFATRFLLYTSGVIFPIDRFFDHYWVKTIVELNPIYQILHMYRQALMWETPPTAWSWIVCTGWACALVVSGAIFFWRGESTYGR